MAAALAVKAGEVIHAVLARDAIMGGTTIEQGFSVEPVCFTDETAGQVWGIQAACMPPVSPIPGPLFHL